MKKRNAILKAKRKREFNYKKDHVLNVKEYFDYDRNLWFDECEVIFLAGLAKAGLKGNEIYFKKMKSDPPKTAKGIYNLNRMREDKDGELRGKFLEHCGKCAYHLEDGDNVTSEGIYLETAGENNGNTFKYYKAMYLVRM